MINMAEQDRFNPLGLQADTGHPVPLKSINVDIHITGYVAEVSSRMTYFNEETSPIETVFTFPVDDGSAVFHFVADIEGHHIVAVIQEKEQALLTYQDAIDHGKTAMLLKEDNFAGDIFSCMLGNLPPQSEATLLMKYVVELPQEPDGRLRFTLPTVLNPRYCPEIGGEIAAEGATYVPPCKVPYEFSMTATIQGYHKVTSVESSRVKLDVQLEENNTQAKVHICEDFRFDHDLCFLVQYETPYTPHVVLEDGNPEGEGLLKEDILMISFHPDLREVAMATNGEYVFVIDRSGSMGGDRIQNAKEALLLFLKSLPPDCYFNIISFGSNYNCLFSAGSKQYTENNMQKATKLAKEMSSDMGGTNILKPLQEVFKQTIIDGHPRSVFVVTDGQVTNTNEVIALVRKQSKMTSTRVYTLGIGSGVSTSLVKGIARNGGGKSEFITGDARIQSKVVSLLKCAMQPAITNITIDWDLPPGVIPISIPTEPPTMISCTERLTVYAIMQGVDKNTIYAASTMTLKGQQNGSPVLYAMTFTLCEADDISTSAPVHRLATKEQIKLLQDQETEFVNTDDVASHQEALSDLNTLPAQIIDLSRHGNVVSRYSAFVAIDVDGKKVEGKSVQRSCPVPTTSLDFLHAIAENNMRCCLMSTSLMTYSGYIGDSVKCSKRSGSAKPSKRGGILGCGPTLPKLGKLFSKKRSKMASSAPTKRQNPVSDEADAIDSTDLHVSVEDEIVDGHVVDTPVTAPDHGNTISTDSSDNPVTATVYGSSNSTSNTDSRPLKALNSSNDDGTTSKKQQRDLPSDDQMLSMVDLQQLHGQWKMSEKLLQLLCVSKEELDKLKFSEDPCVICTVTVICWLRKQFLHRQEEWQMIEAKAMAWLSSQKLTVPIEDTINQTTQDLWPK